ncbi:MAG: hypothetical protein NVSMB6_24060 [Burkholderiaceae bacterium]
MTPPLLWGMVYKHIWGVGCIYCARQAGGDRIEFSDRGQPEKRRRQVGRAGQVLLAGDPTLGFAWTRPMVQRSKPGPTRPYRKWTMNEFLDDIEAS